MSTPNNLSAADQKAIEAATKKSVVYKWLNIKDSINFNVGDYVVKYTPHWDNWDDEGDYTKVKWKPEVISYLCPVPKKYMVVHVDEYQVPFVKLVGKNGKPTGRLICLASQTFISGKSFFKIDQDYADHCLLADPAVTPFDPNTTLNKYREFEKEVEEFNESIRIKFKDIKEAHDWIKKQRKGDTFYFAVDLKWGRDSLSEKNTVVKRSFLDEHEDAGDDSTYFDLDIKSPRALVYKIWDEGWQEWNEDSLQAHHLLKGYLFTTKPRTYERE